MLETVESQVSEALPGVGGFLFAKGRFRIEWCV
jgi:hypothetical protein